MPEDKDPKDPDKEKPQKSFVAKTPVDLQRLKLEKLMKNPVGVHRFSKNVAQNFFQIFKIFRKNQ